MADLIKVCNTSDVAPGTMKHFLVDGYDIMVTNLDSKFYAIDNVCPHMGGNLSAGTLNGTVVTCPRHKSQFDVRDGKVVRWAQIGPLLSTVAKMIKPPRPAYAYKVTVDNNTVMVEKPPKVS